MTPPLKNYPPPDPAGTFRSSGTDLLDPEAEAGMGHIELARRADLVLIAPATADFIASMVHGRANSLRCDSGHPARLQLHRR